MVISGCREYFILTELDFAMFVYDEYVVPIYGDARKWPNIAFVIFEKKIGLNHQLQSQDQYFSGRGHRAHFEFGVLKK